MKDARPQDTAWLRLGPADAPTPLVVAVPHAGRVYSQALLAAARLPRAALETIEDRFADLLIADAVALGAVAIVARQARALVDLNRDPREIDPGALGDAAPDAGWIETDKVAGGLGVVPTRIAAGGAVWRGPLAADDFRRRIEHVHQPYHRALAAALAAAHARHGVAILIDCHSMPPLPGRDPARIVLGDRCGRSAGAAQLGAAAAAVRASGHAPAFNDPYAGGFTLERHGRPHEQRHAIQIEIDRSLYLDATFRRPASGLAAARRLVGRVARALIASADPLPIAAE